jgi:hypothetical protein
MKSKFSLGVGVVILIASLSDVSASDVSASEVSSDILYCFCADPSNHADASHARAECKNKAVNLGYKDGDVRIKKPTDTVACIECLPPKSTEMVCKGYPPANPGY